MKTEELIRVVDQELDSLRYNIKAIKDRKTWTGKTEAIFRRLHTRVTAQTYRKLEQWAIVEKCSVGRVIDKLTRDRAVMMRGEND